MATPSPTTLPTPIITLPATARHGHITIQPWTPSLAPSLVPSANNHAIWLQLRDRMPHPYTLADAEWYTNQCASGANWPDVLLFDDRGVETVAGKKLSHFAIVRHGNDGAEEAVGSIGLVMGEDVARRGAELGYWLAEKEWGKGIVGEIVPKFVEWAWQVFPGLIRVHTEIYALNERSAGVMKKCGFVFEGRQRASTWKNGKIGDTLAYAILRPGLEY